MKYESMVNICLSRFLSVYKITEFYNNLSSYIGAKVTTSRAVFTASFNLKVEKLKIDFV